MLRRKFAVIKFWPGLNTAEDEVIARLQLAANAVNLQCLVVDAFGRLIDSPHAQLTRDDVDFLLNMHFEAPKQYDIFSFVTLWNPLPFYYEWGYRKHTRHLLTHDDFLTCDSVSGDDQVMRSASADPMRDRPYFHFYPTISEPILTPTLGNQKLFYVGINWERTANKPGRHSELLTMLDRGDDLRIYGPKLFGGIDVWEGHKNYVGPIPFDGVSVVRQIRTAGIALVLSSEAHRDAEMMSCRIFESMAAGVITICDENAFARRHFGDTLLYIDTRLPAEESYGQVQAHLDWIKSNPTKALEMAKAAQDVFRANFRLDTCLERIYAELPARRQHLESLYSPIRPEEKICAVFLLPEYRPELLDLHVESYRAQQHVCLRPVLAMDPHDIEVFGPRIRARLQELAAPFELVPIPFLERFPNGKLRRRRLGGEVLAQLIRTVVEEDYVAFVAPDEKLFSDHFASLLRTLQDAPDTGCAWSDMLYPNPNSHKGHADLADQPEVNRAGEEGRLGTGRFLFRAAALAPRLDTALPHLDQLAMHLLVGATRLRPTRRCTLMSTVPATAPAEVPGLPIGLEREILIDYDPELFRKLEHTPSHPSSTPPLAPPTTLPISDAFENLSPAEKTKIAVELAHSVPIPAFIKNFAFGVYRLWFRATSKRL